MFTLMELGVYMEYFILTSGVKSLSLNWLLAIPLFVAGYMTPIIIYRLYTRFVEEPVLLWRKTTTEDGKSKARIYERLRDIPAGIREFKVIQANKVGIWEAMVYPSFVAYKDGVFKIEIIFPDKYPLVPPILRFKTKIYHPNVARNGRISLDLFSPKQWKHTTEISRVFEALLKVVNEPKPDDAVRKDLAEEFVKNRAKFIEKAKMFTQKHAERVLEN